jgi:Zn-dependent protease
MNFLSRLMHPELILYSLPGILIGLVLHELAHAFVADRLGDPTPRMMGRLTLNPLPHIDPVGLAMLILAGFGWAKPVITNPAKYKIKRYGFALVGIAGPLTNLLLTVIFLFSFNLMVTNGIIQTENFLYYIMSYAVSINAMLFIFNLIPIPPLDGYNILKDLFLIKMVNPKALWNFERYGQFLLIGFIVVTSYGNLNIIGTLVGYIITYLDKFYSLLFH